MQTTFDRCEIINFTIFYDIYHGLTPYYLKSLLPPNIRDSTPYHLRSDSNLSQPNARTNTFFFINIDFIWNTAIADSPRPLAALPVAKCSLLSHSDGVTRN